MRGFIFHFKLIKANTSDFKPSDNIKNRRLNSVYESDARWFYKHPLQYKPQDHLHTQTRENRTLLIVCVKKVHLKIYKYRLIYINNETNLI